MMLPQPRPLTNKEQGAIRPACIWLNFYETDDCMVLPAGQVEIDWYDGTKIVKKNVDAFCRVYNGAEGDYVYDDFKLPLTKIRYFGTYQDAEFVTDIHGQLIKPL